MSWCVPAVVVVFMTWCEIEECVINAGGMVSAEEDETTYRGRTA